VRNFIKPLQTLVHSNTNLFLYILDSTATDISSDVAGNLKVSSYPEFSMETVKTFVLRKGLLNEVRSQLTRELDGRQAGVRKVGIWGSGGTGKSQLARSYLQEYGNQYDATFWIHAVGPETLEFDFQGIYGTLPNP
jgi:predicted AAA+ superfamily ATPase